jgi:bisphosphoglycerate-independent phosphoglycerate mutase (AlkP superfamily)
MKVVCINNMELGRDSNGKSRLKRLPLTIGKTYESIPDDQIISQNVRFYAIEKDNDDESRLYAANYFVTLDVWREQQLNRIL